MKKNLFKKCFAAALMLVFTTSAFAAKNQKNTAKPTRPEVWVLDFADGLVENAGAYDWHDDNSGDSGYGFGVDFTSTCFFALPKKGEKIRLTGKIISDVDMPYLSCYFNDSTNGWKSLSWTEMIASDIKAGVPVEIDKEIEIRDDSEGRFRLELQYDLTWGEYAELPRIGESVSFSFERTNESTDSYEFKTTNAEKWVIDICDADRDVTVSRKGPEETCYSLDRKYDALFTGVFPRKGDFIEVNIKGVSDTDIPHLNFQLVDNSEDVNWWQDICTTYWPSIKNIKAGVPFSVKLLFPVDNPPKGDVMVRFHYDGEWEKEWRTTPDVGKPVNFTFERTKKSFDFKEQCEKIGLKNPPAVYKLDLADSDLGPSFNIEWLDEDWAKCYRAFLSFRHLLKNNMPKAGDYIVFSYDMTVSEDIPYLSFQFTDASKKNSWNQPYKPDYLDFTDVKAGEHISGKYVTKVTTPPIFDTNIQIVYDSSWQLENHPAAGVPAEINFTKVSESTDTVKRRAPKTYKIDITKLLKDFDFGTADKNFGPANDPSEICYYLTGCDITSLFKKGDLPMKGDTVEVTYAGAFPQDFSGIFIYLFEQNDYIWGRRLAANIIDEDNPDITELEISAGKKIKHTEKLTLTWDTDLNIIAGIGLIK